MKRVRRIWFCLMLLAGGNCSLDSYVDDSLLLNAFALINDWWDYGWGSRIELNVNQEQSSSSLRDFQLMVSVNSDRLDYNALKPDGSDIRFVDSAGNVLAYETEVLNHEGNSVFWVRVPELTPGANRFWLYYHNFDAGANPNTERIWTDDYLAVYHLSETGGNGSVRGDVAPSGNHGSFVDANGNSSTSSGGKIGIADDFNGDADKIDVGASTTFTLSTFTITGWFRCLDSSQFRTILSRNVSITHRNFYMGLWENGEGFHPDGALAFRTGAGYVDVDLATTRNYCDSQWHFFAAYMDQANGVAGLIVDAEPALTTNSFTVPWSGTAPFIIGHDDFSVGSRFFVGGLDEIRVQNIARDEAWLRAQYLNQNNSYIAYGDRELRP